MTDERYGSFFPLYNVNCLRISVVPVASGMMVQERMRTNIMYQTFATGTKAREKAIRLAVDPMTCIDVAGPPAGVVSIEHYSRFRIHLGQPT